ncbi:DEAD/DEAH box helicase family protein [Streptomyces sp. A13(2022)]|uniref:DEAD/DEAH box helicase family protein n=1 Tax=Streptomyces sp. A13(2022) TaxID=2964768 RepID=UPI0021D81C38|nr:DEAD/DEAH box helicase family protein [Streptomyces sp. A13(2022)]MCU8593777.1 DEAD/DEAH box helicase family protein [Streptomyces sp. A13(2022)]
MSVGLERLVPAASYLEEAFLRWVLTPAADAAIVQRVHSQYPVTVQERTYRLDYLIVGQTLQVAVELDGFAFHSDRAAFTYDRLRQNDLATTGLTVLRFSYDAVRTDTARCVAQLQAMLRRDPVLAALVTAVPVVEVPDMAGNPMLAAGPPRGMGAFGPVPVPERSYFDEVRDRVDRGPLRSCQDEALVALANYYAGGGRNAAAVMAVGAGKTALGVAAALSFTRRRALVVTPGSVIRGTFASALDAGAPGNVLYGLAGGPMLPGARPPSTLVLDADGEQISRVGRERLLAADIVVTNFHALGTGEKSGDLLAKLEPEDVDFIVVDEAHIAASDSYQRLFAHFPQARTLLMSACFTRLDGRPIDADVVYRYRLVDSVADGVAKNLRVHRFAPETASTVYEAVWPDGRREQVVGRDALLRVLGDERKLARITAQSEAPIRQVMAVTRACLDMQAKLLAPIRPRVLFAAMGQAHTEQIARIAEEHGIACATLHHSMPASAIAATRRRFESEAGDLEGIVQLRMLGQGYDFPPITVVVPLRPYGSFGEFYQFVGRGVRVLHHSRLAPDQQYLDMVCHTELGLEEHLEALCADNDMDPTVLLDAPLIDAGMLESVLDGRDGAPDGTGAAGEGGMDAFVLYERGRVEERVIHGVDRVETRRAEREQRLLAQRYAVYAQSTASPVPFEQFVDYMRRLTGGT